MPVRTSFVVCAAVCAAVGCTPESQTDRSSPPLSASPESASASPEQEALDAYEGLINAVVEGSHEGAADHPDLERFAAGQALEFSGAMLDGATAIGEPVLRPEVVESDLDGDPPTVVIEDCVDDSQWVLEGVTAGEADDEDFRLYRVTVVSAGSSWKVQNLWLGDYGEC